MPLDPKKYLPCQDIAVDGLPQLVPFHSPDKPSPDYLYVLEELTLDQNVYEIHKAGLLDAQHAALSDLGWMLVFRGFQLTGSPSIVAHLWRVPVGVSMIGAQLALRDGAEAAEPENYRLFRRALLTQTHNILTPMPYDPWLTPGSTAAGLVPFKGDDALLIDRLTLQRGAMRRFACLKEHVFIPTVTTKDADDGAAARPRFGWMLLASGAALTGRVGTVFNCWRLPDAGRLLRTMQAITEVTEYRELPPCIAAEDQDLYDLHVAQRRIVPEIPITPEGETHTP